MVTDYNAVTLYARRRGVVEMRQAATARRAMAPVSTGNVLFKDRNRRRVTGQVQAQG